MEAENAAKPAPPAKAAKPFSTIRARRALHVDATHVQGTHSEQMSFSLAEGDELSGVKADIAQMLKAKGLADVL